jgi:hypothetical protein
VALKPFSRNIDAAFCRINALREAFRLVVFAIPKDKE